jgi:hypothetical protein
MRNKAKRDVEKILPIILYTGKSLMVERDAGTDPRWMGGQPREEQTKKGAGDAVKEDCAVGGEGRN